MSALVQYTTPQARAELASAKRLLACTGGLRVNLAMGRHGTTHKAFLRWDFTILNWERTRDLFIDGGKALSLVFPSFVEVIVRKPLPLIVSFLSLSRSFRALQTLRSSFHNLGNLLAPNCSSNLGIFSYPNHYLVVHMITCLEYLL